jgi:hypothetical protein
MIRALLGSFNTNLSFSSQVLSVYLVLNFTF